MGSERSGLREIRANELAKISRPNLGTWAGLREPVERERRAQDSEHDFGKRPQHIILLPTEPRVLHSQEPRQS